MGISANAQTDGFFCGWNEGAGDRTTGMTEPSIMMPGTTIGDTGNAAAPLGSGMLILTALGAGYVAMKKKEN